MHPYDKFRSDMANRTEPDKPNSDGSVPNRTASAQPLDSTVHNLFRFDRQQTIPNCTVITLDGLDGFMWIGPDGVRHNEGLRWPTMRIHKDATVEVLFGPNGERSAGWRETDGQ